MKFYIQMSIDEEFYLNGYDGSSWEWTQDKKTAWTLRIDQATLYLKMMKPLFPSALLLEA